MSDVEAQLREANAKLIKINGLREALKDARLTLMLVNQYGKSGQVWQPDLCLKRAEAYTYNRDVSIRVKVPFGVIQQQAVYAVAELERALIAEGVAP